MRRLWYSSEITPSVMIAVLIPFFLTANLAVNDSAWRYGPEYTFVVGANFTMLKKGSNIPTYNVHSTTHLLCRPRSIDTLNCRFRNIRGAADRNAVDMHLHSEPFDVKFNNKGITELVVSKNAFKDSSTLGPMKQIANLLSIGTDLTNRPDGDFDDIENFVLGECSATFNVKHLSDEEDSDEKEEKDRSQKSLRLSSLPSLNKVPGENVHVDKERDLKRCKLNQNAICFEDMVLGRYVYKDINCTTKVELEFSDSRIDVTDEKFESQTFSWGLVEFPNPDDKETTTSEVTEEVNLVLLRSDPATSALQEIINPTTTRIPII